MAAPSDAPQHRAGAHTRAGNAMQRTRTAILLAAAECVARDGVRRTTMAGLASSAGIAKATLYNHFRTKDDVLEALVDAQVASLGIRCAELAADAGLVTALAHAASVLADFDPLRRVAADEPDLLAALARPGGDGWQAARAAVAGVLTAAGGRCGDGEVDVVLRWLLSQLLWPVPAQRALDEARVLAGALTPEPARPASLLPIQGRSSEEPRPAGLGWPG